MCGAPLAAAELCRFRICISDWPRNSHANTGFTDDRTTLVLHDTCAARYPDPGSGIHVPRRSGTLWSAAPPFALSAGRCVPLTASAWARPASTGGADHTARGGTRTDRRTVCGSSTPLTRPRQRPRQAGNWDTFRMVQRAELEDTTDSDPIVHDFAEEVLSIRSADP